MAIVYRNESTVVIGEQVWIFQVIALVFLLIAGPVFTLHTIPPFYISCEIKQPRIAEQCTVYQLFFASSNKHYMDKITYAGVGMNQSSDIKYRGMEYHIDLISGAQIYSLNMMPSRSRDTIERSMQAINHYIQTSYNKTFRIPHLYSWFYMAFFLSFPTIGIIILIVIKAKKVTFDKLQNKMIVESRWLFFVNTKKTYSLDEINYITVAIDEKRRSNLFRLECILNNKQTIPLSTLYSTDYNIKKNELKAIAKLGITVS